MSGTVEWAVLIFVGGIAAGCMIVAWNARGMFNKYDLSIADVTKDVRHLKNNFDQHKIAAGDDHDKLIRVESEVARLGKIVNGKH